MPKILIIDDERDLIDLLSYNLEKEGYSILIALDGSQGKELATSSNPDLIILDLMLPGIDGLELCRMLRKEQETASIPIIMLTAKGEEIDKVLGLEMGADDYVTKPFSVREIVARVKAQLRRTTKDNKAVETYQFGALSVDISTHEVTINGRHIKLSPLEFKLLKFFITHQERVYSRDQLLDYVWGDEAYVEPRTVDVHIRRLREKIEPEGTKLIKTIRGAGYRFSATNDGGME
ncbi:MAG: phosphate regulon transcriptional regulator PhoB [Proteobacteria bacterium]|nr:phosphate regulon transcriptional regulator PhoB [Pseudomonadota bacterium]